MQLGADAELLEPVYDAHVADVLESLENSVLQSDDTTVVQRNGNQPGCRDVHVWAWRDHTPASSTKPPTPATATGRKP
ncbi:MAG: hypothetical protein H6718_00075 [Polyangiaceae bacterium]|nr:hypothetical protein [Polyangiaceae bacterium]